MKKTLFALLSLFSVTVKSQTAFDEKSQHVTIGYGFPNLYKVILKASVKNSQSANMSFGGISETYTYKAYGLGPAFIKYDYALTKNLGIGFVLGYFSAGLRQTYTYQDQRFTGQSVVTQNYTDVTTVDFQSFSVGARFNYHFGSKGKLDPYIGFAAGYSYATASVDFSSDNPNSANTPRYTSTSPIPLYLGMTFGLRYYFSQNIGIYGEFGLDKWAVIQGGLAIKFD